jgi:hypothetical protein
MWRGGGEVRIASTSKDSKLLICGRCVVKGSKGTRGVDNFGGKAIENISGCMKSIYPIAGGMDAWSSKVRNILLVVRSMRSALPFCGDV